ncbi:MAG: hypothetical protein J6J18_02515 [Oscillospiraceae bacterium]|nr:hypothetical protein [Oscillospiraceae bacterium]
MKNGYPVDIISVILSAGAAILNATPRVVMMRFAGDGYTLYDYVSGFSLTPVGYGIWGAMAAGICAIVLTVLGIINCVKNSARLRKWMLGISVLALLMILSLLLVGSMTFISFIIAVLLAVETLFLYYNRNNA